MKSVSILLSLVLSTGIYASSITRVFDGANAKCSNKHDVFSSQLNGLYSLSNPKVALVDNQVEVELDIKFFECKEVGSDFKLVKVDYKSESEVEFMGNKMTRIELEKEVRAINDSYEVVSKVDLISAVENEGSSKIKLVLSKEEMNVNEFSTASEKGDLFINLDMTTVREIHSENYSSGKERITFGQFRLFIDTKNQKAIID